MTAVVSFSLFKQYSLQFSRCFVFRLGRIHLIFLSFKKFLVPCLCFIKATAMHKFVSFRGVIGAACVQNRIHFANECLASYSASRENQTPAKVLSDRAAFKRASLDFFQVLQNVSACRSAVCTAQAQALIGNPTSASVYLSIKRRLRLIFYIDVAGMETLSLEQMDCMNTLSFEHLGVMNERKF